MKKESAIFIFVVLLLFICCGPAAESRENMYGRGKIISDSMAGIIRSAMEEAKAPAASPTEKKDSVIIRTDFGYVPTPTNGC